MKKIGGKIAVVLAVIALLGVYYYVALPAVNIHATEFWIFLVILVVLAALIYVRKKKLNRYEMKESKGLKAILTVLVVIVAVYLLGSLLSSPIVNAKKYQKLMKVETGEFTKDIEELSFDQIPLLDRDSATLLTQFCTQIEEMVDSVPRCKNHVRQDTKLTSMVTFHFLL